MFYILIIATVVSILVLGGTYYTMSLAEENRKYRNLANILDEASMTIGFITTILILSTLIAGIYAFTETSNARLYTINNNILIYEEKNASIEREINEIVEEYLKHEDITYEPATDNLLNVFPTLASSELISQQLSVIKENNDKIIELEKELVDYRAKKMFWFGTEVEHVDEIEGE